MYTVNPIKKIEMTDSVFRTSVTTVKNVWLYFNINAIYVEVLLKMRNMF